MNHLAPTCMHDSVRPSPPKRWWRVVIDFMRRWSGDDAYERYVAAHHDHGHILMNRREFYRRYLDKRGSGSRCC